MIFLSPQKKIVTLVFASLVFFQSPVSLAFQKNRTPCLTLLGDPSENIRRRYDNAKQEYGEILKVIASRSTVSEAENAQEARKRKIQDLKAIKEMLPNGFPIPEANEENLALFVSLLEYLGYDPSLLNYDMDHASESLGKAKIKELNEKRISTFLYRVYSANFVARDKAVNTSWSKRNFPDTEFFDRQRVEQQILKIRALPDLIEATRALGLIDPRPSEGFNLPWGVGDLLTSAKKSLPWWVGNWLLSLLGYGSTVATDVFNSYALGWPKALWYFTLAPQLTMPNLLPSGLARPLPNRALDITIEKGWDDAYPELKNEGLLRNWGKVDQGYQAGRKVYLAAAKIGVLYLALLYSPWLKTIYSAVADSRSAAEYEHDTYDSAQVVQEQYDMWYASLPKKPSKAQEKAMWNTIKKNEAAGVYRIYKEK